MIWNCPLQRWKPTLCLLATGVVAALQSPAVLANEQALEAQRALFAQARMQLASGRRKDIDRTLNKLDDYPLRDFLEFESLQKSWASGKPSKNSVKQLNAFEQNTTDHSLTRRLTRQLQRRFAATDQWSMFLGLSKSRLAAKMPCTSLRARHETGTLKVFDQSAVDLWVQPKKHAEICHGVLEAMEQGHTPPVSAIWERIFKSMEANKAEFAKPMLGYLASADRKLVQRWIDASDNPAKLLKSDELAENSVLNRRIIADLIVDWSRKDTVAAVTHWLSIRGKYTFFDDRYYDTHRAIVMRGAYRRLPEAQAWLEATDERDNDLELAEWRIRTALLVQDWPAVLNNISRLPDIEQAEDHWAYWAARAHEKLGRESEASQIYKDLSTLQSYHGFLAADRIGEEYAIFDEPIEPDTQLLARLRTDPALERAREFAQMGLAHESRRTWNNWVSGQGPEQLAASAIIADEWGLRDRAIYSAGRSGEDYRRAISIRFPVLYRSEVARVSSELSIDPSWVFGVMRRESAYIHDVKSPAGAVGLMQLMPRTARYVAADLQGQENWRGDLTDPLTNIGLGTHYLRYVMDRFDGHQVLATASYNAGPHRVDGWLLDSEIDADVWIDTIVFTETRRYVRAVLAYAAIYEYRLTGKPQRLSRKLTKVPAASNV